MHKIFETYFARFNKNVKTQKQPKKFFTQLDDNYLQDLPYIVDIENWCLRAYSALKFNEKICIYSDYDTDAVTATSTMYWGLLDLGFKTENLTFYAPDRFTEGYGMNPEAVEILSKTNNLIISVDCGINSVVEAEKVANLENCDLMITDHHHLQDKIPDCKAVVNPRVAPHLLAHSDLAKIYFEKKSEEYSAMAVKLKENKKIDENTFKKIVNWRESIISARSSQDYNNYLSESVTGVGVAWFCLVWLGYFMNEFESLELKKLNKLLPFVAIGTVADCQSVLEPTNRLLVRAGLSVMQQSPENNLGLSQILKQTKLLEKMHQGYKLNSQDLAFTLSPILNSSGRLSHAKLSIKTLLANEEKDASDLATKLIKTNQDRKQMVKDILGEVDTEAENQVLNGSKMIWLQGEWSKGIVGLLASRLVSMHGLPVVVVSKEDDLAVASLRAPEGYHLPNAMSKAGEFLIKFGGHPGAAGFSAKISDLEAVKKTMEESLGLQEVDSQSKPNYLPENFIKLPEILKPFQYEIKNIWLKTEDINQELISQIWTLDPFGQDFPMPELVIYIDKPDLNFKFISLEKHLKLTVNNVTLTVFNISEATVDSLKKLNFERVWLVCRPSQNTWNGQTSTELIVQHIHFE